MYVVNHVCCIILIFMWDMYDMVPNMDMGTFIVVCFTESQVSTSPLCDTNYGSCAHRNLFLIHFHEINQKFH